VQEESIGDFQSCLLNVFVGAMDGVACLKAHDAAPAAAGEHAASLSWRVSEFRELARFWPVEEPDIATQKGIAVAIETGHTGMCFLFGMVHTFGFSCYVSLKLLGDRHDRQGRVILP
jgi:hypothetical protein